jgi:hypothetical protein
MDLLDDPDLGRFHEIVSPESRRASYDKHGRTLDRLMAKLNADFREMDSGVLIRLVLDVERGRSTTSWFVRKRSARPCFSGTA